MQRLERGCRGLRVVDLPLPESHNGSKRRTQSRPHATHSRNWRGQRGVRHAYVPDGTQDQEHDEDQNQHHHRVPCRRLRTGLLGLRWSVKLIVLQFDLHIGEQA